MGLPSILSTDQLGSAQMWAKWQDKFSRPPCVNDFGCFFVAPDPMGIRDVFMPPFSTANENTALLYVNRKHPGAEGIPIGYTWYPDRVERRCTMEGVEILTVTRAAVRQVAALILLSVRNPGPDPRDLEIAVKVAGRAIHTIEGWQQSRPDIDQLTGHPEAWHYDAALGAMCFTSAPKAFSVHGSRKKPDAVENKALLYNVHLKPGERWDLRFVVALGESENDAAKTFLSLVEGFDKACQEVRDDWNHKIAAVFTPGNSIFSGHLPVLFTEDKELEKLYYMGAIGGALCNRRDNPLSQIGATYVTLTGDSWPTACFLWDTLVSDSCWALLDPGVLRNMIEAWIEMDLSKHLALDYVTKKGVGPWYAINDTALVHMAHTYLRYSGDLEWLNKVVAGTSVVDHLERSALNWRNLDKNGHGLADCGNGWNCGDGLVTWIHETAGFNAMWVAAQRSVAELREIRGEPQSARNLRENAEVLLKNLLGLYVDGGGYWHAKQPDGALTPVRLLYDFVAILESIPDDLTRKTKEEMLRFFERELKTDSWVRGLSSWDDDAVRSFRPDWAWTGAYGAFPAMVAVALYNQGCSEGWIIDWLRRVARTTHQGPIGQTHMVEALAEVVLGGARKGTIGAWTMISTGAFPAMIVERLFGVHATLRQGLRQRGYWAGFDPTAELENLPFQGRNYRVTHRGIEEA